MSDQPPTYYSPDPQWERQQPNTTPPQSNPYGTAYDQSYSQTYDQPAYNQPAYNQPGYMPPAANAASEPGSGMALAGLILGIVSIIFFWIPFFGLPLPAVGIILSLLGRRSVSRRTLATVGLVLSIIALAIGLCISGSVIWAIIHAAQTSSSSTY